MPGVWLVLLVVYLLAHLGLYVLVFRTWRSFSRESTIFGYHFVSFCVLCGASLAGLAVSGLDLSMALPLAAVGVAAHAIYSLSVLELWALADASYSLNVLRHTHADGAIDVASLAAVGTSKKDNRVRGLVRLGLARETNGRFEPTGRGRLVATLLRAVAWPANLQQYG
jgi:hypothetical protein